MLLFIIASREVNIAGGLFFKMAAYRFVDDSEEDIKYDERKCSPER